MVEKNQERFMIRNAVSSCAIFESQKGRSGCRAVKGLQSAGRVGDKVLQKVDKGGEKCH